MSLADALDNQERVSLPKARADVDSGGAQINNVVVNAPINGDWSNVLALFNLDPAEFEVVDDTVRMSTWQQSARSKDGDRDSIQLYSYSARFRRVTRDMVPVETVKRWRSNLLRAVKPSARRSGSGTYLMLVADPQIGKKRTEDAVANWKRGVRGHLAEIQRLTDLGFPPAAVHVAFMGDEAEGFASNYASQPHTIELNHSAQLELAFDLMVWTMKQAVSTGLPVSASAVISNHGEWTRLGGKDPITSAGDNASTHLARQVKRLFDELADLGGPTVTWTIGEGDPAVTVTLSGVRCYFTHGYVEKGRGTSSETRTRAAIERQILGRTADLGDVPLWYFAHYHHAYSNEFEGRTVWGCPALEAERSSEYMLNQFGVWSPPGMLGMLVGGSSGRRWSHAVIH